MKPDDAILTLWKQQADTGLRIVEEMVEGATKIHEIQLEAAVEAHAVAVATQQSLAGAENASELSRIQAECLVENVLASTACWGKLCEAALETHSNIIGLLCRPAHAESAH